MALMIHLPDACACFHSGDANVPKTEVAGGEPTAGSPSGDGKTGRVGLSGAVAGLVVAVPGVARRVTGRRVVCLGNELSACARRRRSGARCWLDQELVRLLGVTDYRPAAAVSMHSDRRYRTLRARSEDRSGCLQISWTTWSAS